MCFFQESLLSTNTPRNLVTICRSIGIWFTFNSKLSRSNFLLLNIMYCVFLTFNDKPFMSTQCTRELLSAVNFSCNSCYVLPVMIMFASSAYIIKVIMPCIFGKSFMYITNSNGPKILPWGTPITTTNTQI